jgi:hypothetical protein
MLFHSLTLNSNLGKGVVLAQIKNRTLAADASGYIEKGIFYVFF